MTINILKSISVLAIILLISISFNNQARAESGECYNQKIVKVNGMVCDFCARALEKVFNKKSEVNNINVNLNTTLVTIYFNQGKSLDDEVINSMVKESGYNPVSISEENC
jgi:copper chaperone CopZ